jgi:hypothetical protein
VLTHSEGLPLRWRKSSYSGGEGGSDCVEVAGIRDVVAVRDSKNVEDGALTFTRSDWRAFVARVKAGSF